MISRSTRIALLATAALTLIALPASAQFGSIFGNQPPPRPPGSVGPGGPRDIEQIPEPDEADIPQNIPPVQPQRLPPQRAPGPQGLPPQAARPPAQQQPAAPPGGFQAQPLPPPPGAATAPETAAVPPANRPGAPQGPVRPGGPLPGAAPQPGDEVVTEMPAQKIPNTKAVFAGLDKITGRIISFDVALDETVQFGALQVTPKACYTRPPTETQNTDAFAVVDEVTLQGEVRRIFTGWMFASSPGLHAVEHPIYDVWLTDCKDPTPAVASTTPVEPEARPRQQQQRQQQQPRTGQQPQQQQRPSAQTLPPPGQTLAPPSNNPPPQRRALPPPIN